MKLWGCYVMISVSLLSVVGFTDIRDNFLFLLIFRQTTKNIPKQVITSNTAPPTAGAMMIVNGMLSVNNPPGPVELSPVW